jgi:UMF1 family MFS transporter
MGSTALAMHTFPYFWQATLLMALFIGPAQSSSRAYLAKKAPLETRRQLFGLFAVSGKATAFLGPLCISLLIYTTGSLRLGMSSIIAFLILGFLLMPKSERGSV